MCLLLFYVNPDAGSDDLYLVLVSVRDEIITRPTALAHFWEKYPHVIGGSDMVEETKGGTWFALSKKGKIGALLNILQPDEDISKIKRGRGYLVTNFVSYEHDHLKYLDDLSKEGELYNGFLLVTMDISSFKTPKMAFYTNASDSPPKLLEKGFHGFGNSVTPETPWPKVTKAKEEFDKIVRKYPFVSTKNMLVNELFELLQDRTRYPLDENMKKQGKSKPDDFLDKLSAIYVEIPEAFYGSRTHTIIVIDGSQNVDYYESNRYNKNSFGVDERSDHEWKTTHTSFKLYE